jgi:hypothetical protein
MLFAETIANMSSPASNAQSMFRRYGSRIAWSAVATALLASAFLQVHDHGGGWLALGSALMPDLGLLAGTGRGLERGQLAPRAVPLYNALHRLIGPIVLAALVLTGVLPAVWLSAALGWALHISIDRAVGYGLRDADGFQRR